MASRLNTRYVPLIQPVLGEPILEFCEVGVGDVNPDWTVGSKQGELGSCLIVLHWCNWTDPSPLFVSYPIGIVSFATMSTSASMFGFRLRDSSLLVVV